MSVTICGQRIQAAWPSCIHHRQRGRIEHACNLSVTGGNQFTILMARWHFWSWKCRHPLQIQGAANRNTSGGVTGFARESSSSVTGIGEGNWDIRGSSAVPPMTPIAALPRHEGCALGHKGLAFASISAIATDAFSSFLKPSYRPKGVVAVDLALAQPAA